MPNTPERSAQPARRLSLDEWAVAFALLLAIFVRLGVLKHVPW